METSRNASGICNQVETLLLALTNLVTKASLVSSVCSAFTLSAAVKACECMFLSVFFHGDNRACPSDCASLIIAVISYQAWASTEWIEKKKVISSIFLNCIIHSGRTTYWQKDIADSFEHMRERDTHTKTCRQRTHSHTPTVTQHTHKDKHTTWSVHPGDMLELKFTEWVVPTYL